MRETEGKLVYGVDETFPGRPLWPTGLERRRGQVGKALKGMSHKKAVGKVFPVKWQ